MITRTEKAIIDQARLDLADKYGDKDVCFGFTARCLVECDLAEERFDLAHDAGGLGAAWSVAKVSV